MIHYTVLLTSKGTALLICNCGALFKCWLSGSKRHFASGAQSSEIFRFQDTWFVGMQRNHRLLLLPGTLARIAE
jgi:hypothetical protein